MSAPSTAIADRAAHKRHVEPARSSAADGRAAGALAEGVADSATSSRWQSLVGRLRSNATWVVAGRMLGVAATLGTNALLARWLGRAGYGAYAFFGSVISCAALLAMCGLDQAVLRFVSEPLGREDSLRARRMLDRGMMLALATALAAVLLIGGLLHLCGTWLLDASATPLVVWLAAGAAGLLAIVQVIAMALRSVGDFRCSSLLTGQSGGAIGAVALLPALAIARSQFAPTLENGLLCLLVALLLTAPLAGLYLHRRARRALGASQADRATWAAVAHRFFGMGAPVMGTQLLVFATSQADLWVAWKLLPADAVAVYAAVRLLTLIVGMPAQMAAHAVMPVIPALRAAGRIHDLERLLRTMAAWSFVPSALAMVTLGVVPALALGLLFGETFVEGASIVALMAVGQLVFVSAGCCHSVLSLSGRQHALLAVQAAKSAAVVALLPLAAERGGLLGLALGSTLLMIAENVAVCCLARRLVGVWTHLRLPGRILP